MRALAHILHALGFALAVAGFAMVALLFCQRYFHGLPQLRVPIETDSVFEAGPLVLEGKAVRLGAELTVSTRQVGEIVSRAGSQGELDLYRLPVHFEARDESGEIVFSQAVMLDSVGDRTVRLGVREHEVPVLHQGVVLTDPFDPGETPLRFAVTLLPDETFGTRLERAVLVAARQPVAIAGELARGLLIVAAGLGALLLALLAELAPGIVAAYRPAASARPGKVIGMIEPQQHASAPAWEPEPQRQAI